MDISDLRLGDARALLEHGAKLSAMRVRLVERLAPLAAGAHAEISGSSETLAVQFTPGNAEDFASHLARSHVQESRLRQTVVGPHRDDITGRLSLNQPRRLDQ